MSRMPRRLTLQQTVELPESLLRYFLSHPLLSDVYVRRLVDTGSVDEDAYTSKVSCHYCDSVGFTQIPGFLPQNPLKNAEMAVEDDYGMIDGIINNGAKEPKPVPLRSGTDPIHR